MPDTARSPHKTEADDILYGALKMHQPEEGAGPRVNVDTILLAHFARFSARARVIELGCAHGAVSLILAKRRKEKREKDRSQGRGAPPRTPQGDEVPLIPSFCFPLIDAVDIDPGLIGMARRNGELNGLSGEVSFFVSDLREHRRNFRAGAYDIVVMNPPYDEYGRGRISPSDAMARAKHGESCTLVEVVAATKYLLRNGGKFFLVMRAKRTAELFALLAACNVRAKRMVAVHPRPGREASVVLVEAVRAAGDGLSIEPPLFICGPDGEYTEELLAAYRTGECRS